MKVITGDNGTVAGKVCRDIGIDVEAVLTGADLERLDDETLTRAIPHTTVFARVSPDQKSRIIKLARSGGADVAFLGDGVNDAVALHAADVGISVESATDVAKDAADIVLLDKDLGVLADGVMEGRRIFANTMKYVLMATSSNFGNMFSAAGASLFLSFLPMLPSQILLNNLLYDVGQLAIPTDRVDSEVLARPSAWDIAFVRRFMAVFGPVSSVFDFMTFYVMIAILNAGHAEFRTGWFVESLATQTLVIFVIRTRRVPFLRSTTEPGDDRVADRLRRARSDPAVHAARARARLRLASARVLPDPDRDDRGLPRPGRGRQGTLLQSGGTAQRPKANPRRTPRTPRPPTRRTIRAPSRTSDHRGLDLGALSLEPSGVWCETRWPAHRRCKSASRPSEFSSVSPAKTLLLDGELLVCVLGGVYTDVEKTMIELQRATIVLVAGPTATTVRPRTTQRDPAVEPVDWPAVPCGTSLRRNRVVGL